MSHFPTSPVTAPGSTSTTSGPSLRGYSALPDVARSKGLARVKRVARDAAIAGVALAAVVSPFAAAGKAQAAVRPVPAVQAYPGPVTVPSGAVRCTRPGQWHATVPVTTTRTTKAGTHIASVQIQYQHGGRSTLAGQASSKTRTVRVVICVSPSRIEGGYGPVRGIASDVVDGGRSRSFILRFAR